MKKILLIILTLFSIASYSQVKQVYPQYGGTWKKLYLTDSGAFRLPIKIASTKDFNSSTPDSGQIYYDPIDSSVKVWTGTQWMNLGGSGGGTWGTPNTNIGSFYRLLVPSTQGIKGIAAGYGTLWDSTSNANSLTSTIDTNNIATKWYATNNFSNGDTTVFETVLDSTAQPGQRVLFSGGSNKIRSDSYFLYDSVNNKLMINHFNISAGGPNTKLFVNGNATLAGAVTLNSAIISNTPTTSAGTYDILTRNTSGGALEKISSTTFLKWTDTLIGLTNLATQGDIDRAIVASIPTLQQVINAGNTIASGANNNTISASAISMTDATNTGYFSPTISYVTNGSEAVAITPSYVSFGTNGFLELLKAQAALSANRDIYLPNGNVTDTLATLANVRSGGGAADGNGIYTGNGSLSGNTTITQSTNTLTFNGSTTGNQILSANSSTGTALKGTTTGGGTGVWGETSGNGWGGYFKSATGNGIEADGGTGTGVYSHTSTGLVFSGINTGNRTANLPVFAIEGNWASTNSNETIAQFKRTSSGTVDDGISGSIDLMIENLSATTLANRLTARWKESTFATRESELDIDGFNAGTQEVFLRLQHRYIMANNLTDTVAYLSDVRAGGGGAVSLSSVGGGDDIQTGGAGNIRTLNTSDFSVGTNLISIDYTNGQAASTSNKGFLTNTDWNTFNNKQAAFTSSEESFTGADLVSYDGTTGFALTVAHSPISTKNRDVFVNTVLVNSYITSISGSIFTIASLPYTISTSDIILIKYNY